MVKLKYEINSKTTFTRAVWVMLTSVNWIHCVMNALFCKGYFGGVTGWGNWRGWQAVKRYSLLWISKSTSGMALVARA